LVFERCVAQVEAQRRGHDLGDGCHRRRAHCYAESRGNCHGSSRGRRRLGSTPHDGASGQQRGGCTHPLDLHGSVALPTLLRERQGCTARQLAAAWFLAVAPVKRLHRQIYFICRKDSWLLLARQLLSLDVVERTQLSGILTQVACSWRVRFLVTRSVPRSVPPLRRRGQPPAVRGNPALQRTVRVSDSPLNMTAPKQ
jgi:hypothetical protein